MNPTPLNYSTNAIEDFNRAIENDYNSSLEPFITPGRKHNLDYMADYFAFLSNVLHEAVKFTLPDNGRLMDPAETIITSKELELLMLPFPVVALEYSAPDLNDRLESENQASHKRISLAMNFGDAKQKFKDEMLRLFPSINLEICNDRIAVFSIFHAEGKWQSTLGCTFLGKESTFETITDPDGVRFLQVGGMRPAPLFLYAPGEPVAELNVLMQAVHNDTVDEVIALVEFCAIMNCNNVGTQIIKAPEKLNKKRALSGKFQLYDYHVLMINPLADKSASNAGSGGTHSSPRMHLRRGHIRRLASTKVVWVNAAVIGNKSNGVIEKSYQLDAEEAPAKRRVNRPG